MAGLKTVSLHDLEQVQFILGGFDLAGYSDGGGIEYASGSDLVNIVRGAVGDILVNRINDNSLLAIVSVLGTSAAARILHNLQTAQQLSPVISPLDWYMFDPTTGDLVVDEFPIFVQRALPSQAQDLPERAFQILLPNGALPDKMQLGPLNP